MLSSCASQSAIQAQIIFFSLLRSVKLQAGVHFSAPATPHNTLRRPTLCPVSIAIDQNGPKSY